MLVRQDGRQPVQEETQGGNSGEYEEAYCQHQNHQFKERNSYNQIRELLHQTAIIKYCSRKFVNVHYHHQTPPGRAWSATQYQLKVRSCWMTDLHVSRLEIGDGQIFEIFFHQIASG